MKQPLVNAPAGYVWRWRTYRIAHLVQASRRRTKALCGKRARGTWLSFQVGGYSAAPCGDCLRAQP